MTTCDICKQEVREDGTVHQGQVPDPKTGYIVDGEYTLCRSCENAVQAEKSDSKDMAQFELEWREYRKIPTLVMLDFRMQRRLE
ncbi:MAG: hypothetical protein PVS3B3_32410 [Ktedonobacteraceae bacterium]